VGYCFDKLGELNKAVACARRAAELEPDNGVVLSDLGWVLVEAKLYEEAERVLEKAVMLSPSDYETARYNLKELRRRMKLTGRRKQRGNDEGINNC
jgi:Tfp pilus assembly protein PilF